MTQATPDGADRATSPDIMSLLSRIERLEQRVAKMERDRDAVIRKIIEQRETLRKSSRWIP